jgi:hypothetical protein
MVSLDLGILTVFFCEAKIGGCLKMENDSHQRGKYGVPMGKIPLCESFTKPTFIIWLNQLNDDNESIDSSQG